MRTLLQRLPWILVASGVLAAIVWAFIPSAAPVDLAEVRRGELIVTVDEDGKTRLKERYVVSAPLGGRLQRISLDPGDPVTADETMVAMIEPIDPALLDVRARAEAEARVQAAEAALNRAEANSEAARAEHEFAETELARVRDMASSGAGSQLELDEAIHEHRVTTETRRAADFAQDIARFELAMARSALLRTQGQGADAAEVFSIRSPITGRVQRVFQESVAVIAAGTPLLELGDTRDLELVIDVLSSDAVKIPPGAPVLLEHWGGEQLLRGVVRTVEPSAYTRISALGVEEQRVNVIADLVDVEGTSGSAGSLGDGYRVEARIVIWRGANIVTAPMGALFRHGDQWAAFVARNGRAVLRTIEVGRQNGLDAEIIAGLDAGEQVVLYPSDRVKDGSRIKPR